MQHLGKVMARQNAQTAAQQSANLYCGFGCNPFGGSLPTPQFLNIGSAPTSTRPNIPSYVYASYNSYNLLANRHECLVGCHSGSGHDFIPSYGGEEPEPYPWLPDYFAIEVGVPIPHTLIGGLDFVLTADKYGRLYFGAGPGVGTSPLFGWKANVSAYGGYIQDANTTRDEAYSFITKWSGSLCAGFGPGVCVTNGNPFGGNWKDPKNWAVQVGGFTPQIDVGVPYSCQIYPLEKNWSVQCLE